MDSAQADHLRAYGLTYWVLTQGQTAKWLLNYRGGSFLLPQTPAVAARAREMGVTAEPGAATSTINAVIERENMREVLLEKAPKIAVYTPPGNDPWDDAVTLALEYADIPYAKIWDREVLRGDLSKHDWLHLHHEDFSGQYGKFYSNFHNALWYRLQVKQFEELAREMGYASVPLEKQAVARGIRSFVDSGGFLFAMCSATDTLDIALAADGVDIVAPELDNTPIDPNFASKLDFTKTLAFQNFTLIPDPTVYEHSSIDASSSRGRAQASAAFEEAELFEFSAKYDPVPSMLCQNHVKRIPGYFGQTTSFVSECIRPEVIQMAKVPKTGRVKYLHSNHGKGTLTFLGGHDPEDPQHIVGDPPTDLSLHKNSPGYRLILNNILFPAAQKMERKT